MKQAEAKRTLSIPVILSALVSLPVVVLGVGFVFHTSLEPDVFGKYSAGYFVFLCLWFLLVVPALALVMASGPRLCWAVRSWFVVLGSIAVIVAVERDLIPFSMPPAVVLLAPATRQLAASRERAARATAR